MTHEEYRNFRFAPEVDDNHQQIEPTLTIDHAPRICELETN